MDILEKVRHSMAVMREYKRNSRLIDDLRVRVSEDVFADLLSTGVMTRNIVGRYFLDNVPVYKMIGYPKGYIAAE